MLTKTDFLGNEYGPGDYVIYGQARDRSINMIKAQVLEIKEDGKVKVLPLAGSRWKGHSQHTYYVDTRTEKRIDPWRSDKYVLKFEHYVDKATGEEFSREHVFKLHWSERRNSSLEYVPRVFHPWVESRKDPVKPVTLTVTENIVKFADGELPAEV